MVGAVDGRLASGPALLWRPQDGKSAILCATLAALGAAFLAAMFQIDLQSAAAHHFGDFFPLWSYPHIAAAEGPAALYDQAAVHRAQMALGMPGNAQNPYPYPPPMLLLLWPLTLLPYGAGYAVWSGGMLLACLAAVCVGSPRQAPMAAILLLAPSTAACLVTGQTGLLLAALLVGGLRLVRKRPLLAGLLLGLLAYKPHFGILVPVALVASGQWRCIGAAAATVAAAVLATSAAFGPALWLDWLHALPAYQAAFDQMARVALMPTVNSNLRLLGAPSSLAALGQALAAMVAVAAVWTAWRRGANRTAIPVLLAATFLATPHAFLYDLPILTAGAVMFAADRYRANRGLSSTELAVIVLVLLLPVAMALHAVHLPISTPVTAAFLALATSASARRYAACGTPASISAAACRSASACES